MCKSKKNFEKTKPGISDEDLKLKKTGRNTKYFSQIKIKYNFFIRITRR